MGSATQSPASFRLPGTGPRRLSPIKKFHAPRSSRRPATAYEPADARVLRALTSHLQPRLAPHLSRRCTHLKGHGGLRGAVRQIHHAIQAGSHRYVFLTDVQGNYDAIDPDILMSHLRPLVTDPTQRSLLYQYLHRCVHRDGVYRQVDHGIPLGCPLSPFLAGLYLTPLNRAMAALAPNVVFYVRFLDDLVILAPNRHQMRRAFRVVNQQLSALNLAQHPDKTFIGKLSRGFDALGSRFDATVVAEDPPRRRLSDSPPVPSSVTRIMRE